MSSAAPSSELTDLYEQLRSRVTEGGMGVRDGLSVLRRQGLHAWIAAAVATPRSTLRAEPPAPTAIGSAAGTPRLIPATLERSPLVCLCTDMLLARLTTQDHQSE